LILGVWRDLRGTFVAGASIGLQRNGIMVRIGAGKIQREGNAGGLGGANWWNPKQGDAPGENGPPITVESQSRSRAIRFFLFGPDCQPQLRFRSEVAHKLDRKLCQKWMSMELHGATARCRLSVPAVCRWQMAMASASEASRGCGATVSSSSRVTMCCTCCFSARP